MSKVMSSEIVMQYSGNSFQGRSQTYCKYCIWAHALWASPCPMSNVVQCPIKNIRFCQHGALMDIELHFPLNFKEDSGTGSPTSRKTSTSAKPNIQGWWQSKMYEIKKPVNMWQSCQLHMYYSASVHVNYTLQNCRCFVILCNKF